MKIIGDVSISIGEKHFGSYKSEPEKSNGKRPFGLLNTESEKTVDGRPFGSSNTEPEQSVGERLFSSSNAEPEKFVGGRSFCSSNTESEKTVDGSSFGSFNTESEKSIDRRQFGSLNTESEKSIDGKPFNSTNTETELFEKGEYFSTKEHNIEERIANNKGTYISDNPSHAIAKLNDDKGITCKNKQHTDRSRTELKNAIYELKNTRPDCVDKLHRSLDKKEAGYVTSESPVLGLHISRSTMSYSSNQIKEFVASKDASKDVNKVLKYLQILVDQGKISIISEILRCSAKEVTAPKAPDEYSPNMAAISNDEKFATPADLSTNCPEGLEIVCELLTPVNKTEQDVNAINNSDQRDKLTFRLNVISPDDFRDAMRNFQLITYELTYTRVFPNNCRMFIELPISKQGFFSHQDDKVADQKHIS